MDLSKLQDKLIAAARKTPPNDHVPYAFEKRIMANLRRPVDAWNVWAFALWRAAASCVVAMLLVGGWSRMSAHQADDLSTSFEQTVLAATDHIDEEVQ